jgi:hypothetical protein
MANDIDEIIYKSLFLIDSLACPNCEKKVEFYLDIKKPRCYKCDHVLPVMYEDIKPVGLLSERAGIKRFKSKIQLNNGKVNHD